MIERLSLCTKNYSMKEKSSLYIMMSGLVMGIAEVIPGVSGGTIAFVAGIYEKLLDSIDGFRRAVMGLKNGDLNGFKTHFDVRFLLMLFLGMFIGIVIGVAVVTHLLENYPPVIWAFFFGLILGSCFYMISQLKLSWQALVGALIGGVVAYFLVSMNYGTGTEDLWFVFFAGAIAITALVLPGISGSFMLLMMGMYTYIVKDTLKALVTNFGFDKLITLSAFALGCLVGLFSIARGLRWMFDHYRNITIGVLTGFMFGSLGKIWPWRNATSWLDKETGQIVSQWVEGSEYKVVSEILVLPSAYSGAAYLMASIVAMVLGIMAIATFSFLEKASSKS